MMRMNSIYRFLLSAVLILALAATSWAATFDLTAEEVTINYPGMGNVVMWGFYETGSGPPATVPGPALNVPDGDSTLTINLTNNLAEPVSLMIPGQNLPLVDGLASVPATMTDSLGRTRVTSMVTPTPPGNVTAVSYSWTGLKPGTYLYESGSHIGVQVPMGLYGAVTNVDAGAAFPYDGTLPDVTLLFSEVDLAMHQEVASGDYGATALTPYTTALKEGYHPELLLLNGMPFTPGASTPLNGNAIEPGDQALVRLLNAGLKTRSVSMLNIPRHTGTPGNELRLFARDGYLLPTPYRQAGAELPPGSTRDLVLDLSTDPAERYIPVYDRMLGLANGGMQGFIEVNAPGIPAHTLTVTQTANGAVSSLGTPGGIDCPASPAVADCSEAVLNGTLMGLHAEPSAGFIFDGWSVTGGVAGECAAYGDCTVTLDADKTVTASFITAPTAIALLSPVGGEMINPDSAYMIHWHPDTATTFSLGYSFGPSYPFRTIATGVTGDSYRWTIPSDVQLTGTVSVMVVGYDATGSEVGRDTSTATIEFVDSLSLTAPNGGETLTDGGNDPFTIMWTDRLLGTTVVSQTGLWLQKTPGGNWTHIATLAGNPGSYDWDVPVDASPTARIGIVFYNAQGTAILSDTSDSVFGLNQAPVVAAATEVTPLAATTSSGSSITVAPLSSVTLPVTAADEPDPLLLLSPDGGEFIPAGTPFTVIWQTTLDAAHFGIEVSVDNGETWTALVSDIQDNQFDWMPDDALSGASQVLLKVTAYDADGQVLASDVSDELFALE